MGKQRQTTLILGEGPTEFYYFKSLCDVYKNITIKPDYPKHTSIKELELKIEEGIALGYSHIFCVIDMDTKDTEPERTQYQKLRAKYAKPIAKPKKGIYCNVEFFETHRCTELFFLYYFRYTSRAYEDQESLLKDLNKSVAYQKTTDFLIKSKGLHNCMKFLEDKWPLSKKAIFMSSPFFYFKNEENLTLRPLHKAFKRGTSSSKWQQAYQAVKHDRINNLKRGNIGNLLLALGALYILNIYYRDTKFESVADKDANNIDWGLGSEIFSVKVSHESGGASNDKIYVRNLTMMNVFI